jgi:hypothetical protein
VLVAGALGLVGAGLAGLALGGGPAGAMPATRVRSGAGDPSQLLREATSAVSRQQGSVQSATETQGSNRATFALEVGRGEGVEQVTFLEGTTRGTTRLVEVDSHLYLKGDRAGLTATDFTPAAAASEANRWIDVPPSSSYGKTLAGGLTLASTAAELQLTGSLHLSAPTTVDGQRVVGITESENGATVVIYLRDSATPLPVKIVFTAKGDSEQIVFQRWGAIPHPSRPARADSFKSSWLKTS